MPFLITVVAGDVAEIFLILFRTLATLFLLFLQGIASVLVGSRGWGVWLFLALSPFFFLLLLGLLGGLVGLLTS